MAGGEIPKLSAREKTENTQTEVALIENELGLHLKETLGINGEYAQRLTQMLLKSSQNMLTDGEVDKVAMVYLKKYLEQKTGGPLSDYMDGDSYASSFGEYFDVLVKNDEIVNTQVERYKSWCTICEDTTLRLEDLTRGNH